MHIAVDLDDVVVDFYSRVIKCYNKEYGESLTLDDITEWDDNPIKKNSHFGPDKKFKNWWAWWETRGLWSDCTAIDGAIGGLYDLNHMGHYIELITSKPSWAREDFLKWLYEWNPYFDQLTVVEEGGNLDKHELTDARVIIDDRPSTLQAWLDTGRPAILFARPWNENSKWWRQKDVGRTYRVTSWPMLVNFTIPLVEKLYA